MEWIFGKKKEQPSKEDIIMAMLDAQGKIISGLLREVEHINMLLSSGKDLDVDGKSLHVAKPIPLHKKDVKDIDVFRLSLI